MTNEARERVDPTALLVDVAAQLEVDLERLDRAVDEAAREISATESPGGVPMRDHVRTWPTWRKLLLARPLAAAVLVAFAAGYIYLHAERQTTPVTKRWQDK